MLAHTGIPKEVLHKWGTRYGFLAPDRDGAGLCLYPPEQVRRLALLRQLLDDGMRPGQIVPLDETQLAALRPAGRPARAAPSAPGAALDIVEWLQSHDQGLLRARLQDALTRRGLRDFVLNAMPALNAAVGNAWASGAIAIKEGHLYVATVQSLLRQSMARRELRAAPGAPGSPGGRLRRGRPGGDAPGRVGHPHASRRAQGAAALAPGAAAKNRCQRRRGGRFRTGFASAQFGSARPLGQPACAASRCACQMAQS